MKLKIQNVLIDNNKPAYLIAEAYVNHNGS